MMNSTPSSPAICARPRRDVAAAVELDNFEQAQQAGNRMTKAVPIATKAIAKLDVRELAAYQNDRILTSANLANLNHRMSDQLRQRLFTELDSIRLIDPHSHIEPKSAASKTLADILGYHYYTELLPLGRHAAGRDRRAGPRPQGKSPPAGRANRAAAEHDSIQLAAGAGPHVFRFPGRTSI